MRKVIVSIVFSLLFFFVSCSNDDNPTTEDGVYSYSLSNSFEKILVNIGDTIPMILGDTLTLYMGEAAIPSRFSQIEVVNNGDGNYTYSPTEVLLSTVIMTLGEERSALYIIFYVDVQPLKERYLIIENSCSVNVNNSLLKNEILAELELSYIPVELSTYKLTYEYQSNDLACGSLEYTSIGIMDQFFTGAFKKNVNRIQMQYDNKVRNYIVLSENSTCYLEQNLTDIFKEKYSTETINKVLITSKALHLH